MRDRTSVGITPAMTLQEVAAQMNVSHQRVRQIEVTALAKLRLALQERGIQAEHFLDIWRRPTRAD